MTQRQITEFKKRVREFYKVIEPIAEYWGQPHQITLSVLVQNLGFDSSDCMGYSLEEANKKVNTILKLIKSISEYQNSHFENWVFQEIDIIYTGIGWED